jgi:Na+-driven multidrug efflux pump
MNTPAEIFEMSYDYLIVMFGGMVFTLLYNTLAAILRALGDTRTPLVVLIVAVFLNVIFDLLFVVVFHWGVAGAAYATLLAQAISAAGCLIYIVKKVPILHFSRSEMGLDLSYLVPAVNY